MPSPSANLVTLRPDLEKSFEAFDLEAQQLGFIAPKVLPISEVASQMGNYGFIPPDQVLVAGDDTRAPGANYSRVTTTFKGKTFNCQEHGREEMVDDREAKAYANYFDAESFAARRARDTVLRNLELRVVSQLNDYDVTNASGTHLFVPTANKTVAINGANGNAIAVSVAWSTPASSAPVTDVLNAAQTIYDNSGSMPNTMVVNWEQFKYLRLTTSIKDQIKFSGLDDPKMPVQQAVEIFKGLFGVQNFLVAGAQYAANNQMQAISLSSIWSKSYVLLAKCATSADFRELCLGRTFHWAADGSSPNGTVESYRWEPARSNVIRVRMDSDEQVIAPYSAFLLTGVVV